MNPKPTTSPLTSKIRLLEKFAAAPVREVHKRPIRTHYYVGVHDKASEYNRRSRASTLHNAIRAAVMHVLQKTAAKAEFYDEDGVRIGWVKRLTPHKIEIFHTDFFH